MHQGVLVDKSNCILYGCMHCMFKIVCNLQKSHNIMLMGRWVCTSGCTVHACRVCGWVGTCIWGDQVWVYGCVVVGVQLVVHV